MHDEDKRQDRGPAGGTGEMDPTGVVAGLPAPPQPDDPGDYDRYLRERAWVIRDTVRAALDVLNAPERMIVEGYYFDGFSFPRLANAMRTPVCRIRGLHQRALGKLECELRPFVARMFGIAAVRVPDCPICRAEWRTAAERILDEKTPEITWGQIAARIQRAVGWRPSTPQTLITHQQRHRRFEKATQRKGGNPCSNPSTSMDNTP